MFIATFDLATVTGCADGPVGSAPPRFWSWDLHDADPPGERVAGLDLAPRRLAWLRRYADAYFAETKVDRVRYEMPLRFAAMASMAKGGVVTNEATVLFLRMAIGVLVSCAAHAGIVDIEGIDIKEARGHLCGQKTFPKGTAKAMTMRACKTLGWAVEDDNQADACALWSLAVGQAHPRYADLTRAAYGAPPPEPPTARRARPNARRTGRGGLFD